MSKLQLLLPFRLEEGTWPDSTKIAQDLYAAVTDQETAELIFGGPVTVQPAGNRTLIKVADYPTEMPVARVKTTGVKVVDDYPSRADSSLIELSLQEEIPARTNAYLRVRVRVFGGAPLWRTSLATGGATVDFRLCDVRESKFVDTERHLRERMLAIDEANIFLMAPSRLVAEARSPEFKYLRMLEAGVWKNYLAGSEYRGSGGSLLVYYWRHKRNPTESSDPNSISTTPITVDRPLRILLSLQRPHTQAWWATGLQLVSVLLLLAIFLRGRDSLSWDFLGSIGLNLHTFITFLLGTTLISSVTFFERLRGWSASRFLKPRMLLRRAERKILSIKR